MDFGDLSTFDFESSLLRRRIGIVDLSEEQIIEVLILLVRGIDAFESGVNLGRSVNVLRIVIGIDSHGSIVEFFVGCFCDRHIDVEASVIVVRREQFLVEQFDVFIERAGFGIEDE